MARTANGSPIHSVGLSCPCCVIMDEEWAIVEDEKTQLQQTVCMYVQPLRWQLSKSYGIDELQRNPLWTNRELNIRVFYCTPLA